MLITNILSSVAEWELAHIKHRTQQAMNNLKSSNKRAGTIPYGFTIDSSNYLIPDKEEKRIIRRIRKLRKNGLSYKRIADRLLEEGVFNRRGKAFQSQSIRNIYLSSLTSSRITLCLIK